MKLFSIKNRLIFLTILVLGGLFIQNSIIVDTTIVSQEMDDLRRQYVDQDSLAVESLLDVHDALSHYTNRINERFVEVGLFYYESDDGYDNEVRIDFRSALDTAELHLGDRDSSGYKMDVEESQAFSLIGYDINTINDLSNLIDTSDSGAYQKFLLLQNTWESKVKDLDNESLTLTNELQNASLSYSEVSHPMGNSEKGFIGNMTQLFNTIKINLNTTNYTADYNYSASILSTAGLMESSMMSIITTWTDIQIVGFTQNVTDTSYIPNELGELDEKLDDSIVDVTNYEAYIANITLRTEEQAVFDKLHQLYFDDLIPGMRVILEQLDVLTKTESEIRNFLQFKWNIMADSIKSALIAITDTVIKERQEFKNRFAAILDSIDEGVNKLISNLNLTIILVLLVIILSLLLQMAFSFNNLNKKFSSVAEGNLSFKAKSSYAKSELGDLEEKFDNVVEQLRGALSTIQITSERLSGIAEELAAGSEEASSSVKEVSDTMREFSGGASEQNIMLSRINEKLKEHLTDVERSSARIGETSNFVLKVAKRTNILGLNASIEAAKAGRYGRGFNVVAEEVRDLSDTTKSSANQIAEIIEDVQYSISRAVEDILREVNVVKEVAENTAAGSEEVNAAALEQVVMLGEISDSSSELAHLASDLNTLILKFKL